MFIDYFDLYQLEIVKSKDRPLGSFSLPNHTIVSNEACPFEGCTPSKTVLAIYLDDTGGSKPRIDVGCSICSNTEKTSVEHLE